MDAYISTLRKEMSSKNLNIVQLKLGNFDYGNVGRQVVVATANIARTEHPGWDVAARAKHLNEQLGKMKSERAKGTPLRELHNTVFDSISRGKGRGGTIFIGRGAWTYDFVGRWVPGSVVGWMMSLKGGDGLAGDAEDNSTAGSQDWEEVEHA